MPRLWSQEKYIAALKYAADAHLGQKAPGSDLPYVVHVAMVAMEIVAALQAEEGRDGDLTIQCALLHDVIEDAGKSYDDLQKTFGRGVAEGVLALTKINTLKSKAEKMADSLNRIKAQPSEIAMVKLADRIVNLQPPPAYWTAKKRRDYREEAMKILDSLGEASAFLSKRLSEKIERYSFFIET
jgi:(p)ppGpp synthase/HD superfamily hydrolase